jgi:hypothetical protein
VILDVGRDIEIISTKMDKGENMKKIIISILVILSLLMLVSTTQCQSDAAIASYNISTAADQFEVFRRVVFYNGITGAYILVVEGYCSIEPDEIENQLELTVKTEDGTYLKHFLGLSDNVTYFAEQIHPRNISTAQYRIIFKPSVIIPTIDIE